MAAIFISYAREDEVRVRQLTHILGELGWTVFWDRRIPAGQTWRSYLGQELSDAGCVIVAWSRYSIASNSVAFSSRSVGSCRAPDRLSRYTSRRPDRLKAG